MADQQPTSTAVQPVPTVNQNRLTLVHVGGVLLIVACILLSHFVFNDDGKISALLVGSAGWLYGKLGFLPETNVFLSFLQRKSPQEVAEIAAMPEPMKQAIEVIQQKTNSIPPGVVEEAVIPVKIVGNSIIPREFVGGEEGASDSG